MREQPLAQGGPGRRHEEDRVACAELRACKQGSEHDEHDVILRPECRHQMVHGFLFFHLLCEFEHADAMILLKMTSLISMATKQV